MIEINQFRLARAHSRVAQPHRKTLERISGFA
jgi:hypothetical protein